MISLTLLAVKAALDRQEPETLGGYADIDGKPDMKTMGIAYPRKAYEP